MTSKQLVQLSKLLSLILRHQPQRFGVTLDAEGYASLEEVLLAVHARLPQATVADVHRVVDALEPDKQRFSILDGEIRANYGHSLPGHIEQPRPLRPKCSCMARHAARWPAFWRAVSNRCGVSTCT